MTSTVKSAVAAAIKAGTTFAMVNLREWAKTYHPATEAEIEAAWESGLAKVAPNVGEVEGK